MTNKVWGLIPARLNSSRLPKKALMKLHEIPMVIHVARRSKKAKLLDHVIVCTDSVEIANTCIEYSVDFCFTPSDCKNGTERILAAKNIIGIPNGDFIIDIQGDEPLITPASIDLVANYIKNKNIRSEIVLPYTLNCPSRNVNVVKVISSNGRVVYLSRSDAPFGFNSDVKLKKHLSVIGFSGESLESFGKAPPGQLELIEGIELLRALEANIPILTFEIDTDSFSVDVQSDFERAERALRVCEIFNGNYE